LGDAATATYDAIAKRLTITVDDAGATTIAQVVGAVNLTGVFTAAHDASVETVYNPAAVVTTPDVGSARGNTGNSGGDAGVLYVYVAENRSTANDVAAAINADGTFRAKLDALDSTSQVQAGTQPVAIDATAVTSGGGGAALDLASGVRIVNGGATRTLDFSDAETVEDLLNIFNAEETGLRAEINADGVGINVRTRHSGADFQIGENGGQTATQLGLRSFTGQTRLDALNYGVGVPTKRDSYLVQPVPPSTPTDDFTIVADSGSGTVDLTIDVSGAETIQDVLDLINNHPANNTGGVAVTARLATTGNGIELVDAGGRPITINAAEGSQAAEYLGLIPAGGTTAASSTGTLVGTDRHYLETSSVFTTLVRLRDALNANDIVAIERAVKNIDADIDRVTFARSDVGAREQALDVTQRNLEEEDVQLRSALSDEVEVDLVEAISNLTARQMSLEASLKATANILQLSLLNFI
jgi:flagellar hook-associated protein 3 FlgL